MAEQNVPQDGRGVSTPQAADDINEYDFFGLAAAYDTLANATRKADHEAFQRAAGMLDTMHIDMLRGLSYLSYVLANVPDVEFAPKQHRLANSVIQEVTALLARMIEQQEEAATDEVAAKHRH